MAWHDCINPFRLPPHGHDFIISNEYHTTLYANKLCPMCWYKAQRMVRNPQPISFNRENVQAYKQAGPDTL